jgi:hypothetical protein
MIDDSQKIYHSYNADATNNNRPGKSTAAMAGPRYGGRAPIQDERDYALPLLRKAGRHGISKDDFQSGTGPCQGRKITQVARLIHNLEKEGYVFLHQRRDGERFVRYVLAAEPLEPRRGGPRSPKIEPTLRQSTSLPNGSNGTKSGWKSEGFSYGNPERKPAQPVHQPNLFKTISDVQDFCARERGVR